MKDMVVKTNHLNTVLQNLTLAEIRIIQLGIVEISNRILHDKTKILLSNLSFLGKIITKIIWTHKYKWMKLKKIILKTY